MPIRSMARAQDARARSRRPKKASAREKRVFSLGERTRARQQSKQANAGEEKRAQIERAAVRDGLTTLATNENLVAGPPALTGSRRPNKTTRSHDTLGRPATNHPSCAGFGHDQRMQNSMVLQNCGAARAVFKFWTLGQLHAGIVRKRVPHGVSYVDVATRFRAKSNCRATFHMRLHNPPRPTRQP